MLSLSVSFFSIFSGSGRLVPLNLTFYLSPVGKETAGKQQTHWVAERRACVEKGDWMIDRTNFWAEAKKN